MQSMLDGDSVIETSAVTAALVGGVWHEVVPGSFRVGYFAFCNSDDDREKRLEYPLSGGSSLGADIGFAFVGRHDGIQMSGPLVSVQAVHLASVE